MNACHKIPLTHVKKDGETKDLVPIIFIQPIVSEWNEEKKSLRNRGGQFLLEIFAKGIIIYLKCVIILII
jgi:hypothetical protein